METITVFFFPPLPLLLILETLPLDIRTVNQSISVPNLTLPAASSIFNPTPPALSSLLCLIKAVHYWLCIWLWDSLIFYFWICWCNANLHLTQSRFWLSLTFRDSAIALFVIIMSTSNIMSLFIQKSKTHPIYLL